ncbi:hypothetical protein [Collimonas humicola]|uniref:hypothetical protein n=1 Tax=Collimonas humicola TaxID=2825886 RepID=UPI001B8AC686|nr:hypothetical protein [Collimonas humicola]
MTISFPLPLFLHAGRAHGCISCQDRRLAERLTCKMHRKNAKPGKIRNRKYTVARDPPDGGTNNRYYKKGWEYRCGVTCYNVAKMFTAECKNRAINLTILQLA